MGNVTEKIATYLRRPIPQNRDELLTEALAHSRAANALIEDIARELQAVFGAELQKQKYHQLNRLLDKRHNEVSGILVSVGATKLGL